MQLSELSQEAKLLPLHPVGQFTVHKLKQSHCTISINSISRTLWYSNFPKLAITSKNIGTMSKSSKVTVRANFISGSIGKLLHSCPPAASKAKLLLLSPIRLIWFEIYQRGTNDLKFKILNTVKISQKCTDVGNLVHITDFAVKKFQCPWSAAYLLKNMANQNCNY